MSEAGKNIQSQLFYFSPPLQRALIGTRDIAIALARIAVIHVALPGEEHDIHGGDSKKHRSVDDLVALSRGMSTATMSDASAVTPDKVAWDLDSFMIKQCEVRQRLQEALHDAHDSVVYNVKAACDEAVDQFLKSNNITADHKMTFMEKAALRAQCRRLTRFIRLIDIFLSDQLRSMFLGAVARLAETVAFDTEAVDADAAVQIEGEGQNQDIKTKRPPLFRVEVNFANSNLDASRDADEQEPAPDAIEAFPRQDEFSDALNIIIEESLDVVNSFQDISSVPDMEMFIQKDEDEDSAAVLPVDTGGAEGPVVTDMASTIRSSQLFQSSRDTAAKYIVQAYSAVSTFLTSLEPYRQLYSQNQNDSYNIASLFESGDIDEFVKYIATYTSQVNYFQQMPGLTGVGMYLADSRGLKDAMLPSPTNCLKAIGEYLPSLAQKKTQALLDVLGSMNPILAGEPATVEAYVTKKATKDKGNAELEEFKTQQAYIRSIIQVLDDNHWTVADDLKAVFRMLKSSLESLETNIQLAETREDEEIKRFSAQVTDECPKLSKKLSEVQEQLDAHFLSDPEAQDDKVLKHLAQQEAQFAKLKSRAERLQEYQSVLKMPVEEFENFDSIGADLNIKSRLWKDRVAWTQLRAQVMGGSITELDVSSLEKELVKFNKTVFLSEKALPMNKVVSTLKDSVEELNPVLPIITDLRSQALKVCLHSHNIFILLY